MYTMSLDKPKSADKRRVLKGDHSQLDSNTSEFDCIVVEWMLYSQEPHNWDMEEPGKPPLCVSTACKPDRSVPEH